MKILSKWAKANPKLARVIIGCCHFLVILNAICLGTLLFLFNWGESKWLLAITGNLFFISYLLYPIKGEGIKLLRHSYVRQKTHDFSFVILSSIILALGVNNFFIHNNQDYNSQQSASAEFIVHKPKVEKKASRKKLKSEARKKIRKLRKQLKQELRVLKKEFKKKKRNGEGGASKALLILLTIIVAILLGALIAALGCSLTCAGHEGLGVALLLLGWTGIIWLSIITIKKISMKTGSKKKASIKKD